MSNLKYGRKPPKNAPAAKFSALRRAIMPAHPSTYDSISGWSGWEMLGNDAEGDCVAVTWATIRRIVTKVYSTEQYPGIDEVLAIYRTQNPNFDPNGDQNTNGPGSSSDQGMDIQTLLEFLVKNGGPDGVKAVAFAKVDHTNLEEMRAALYLFNFLWLGVNVTDRNEAEFDAGQPWDYQRGDQAIGGHSITGTGYDQSVVKMETWAAESALTQAFISGLLEEAWVVIWPEHAEHLDQTARDALDAEFNAVTGGHITWPNPAPTPTPTPTPTPEPTPAPANKDKVQQMLDVAEHLAHELKRYLNQL